MAIQDRFGGVEKGLALGPYPAVSLKQARLKRDDARTTLDKNIDPGEQRRDERLARNSGNAPQSTLSTIAEEWFKHYREQKELEERPLAPSTIERFEWLLNLQAYRANGGKGKPRALRLDNGSELTSIAFTEWCSEQGIELRFIQPGKPDQNAYIERFNKTYRNEVLDAYVFESIEQVRAITESWLREYNEERPHDSLGRVPPLSFMPRRATLRESTSELYP